MGNRQASQVSSEKLPPAAAGVGLRPEHFRSVLEGHASADFLEVHSENFFAEAGGLAELLQDLAKRAPISLHGTSAGLASRAGIPDDYLSSLKALVDRINPVLISDHLCFTWGTIGGELFHGGDLLPVPYTRSSLRDSIANVDKVQSRLGRQIAIENVCAYVDFEENDFDEADFLNQLVRQTGCGLVLDINNLMVNARNRGFRDTGQFVDAYVRSIDRDAIREIHLAGSTPVTPQEVLIDDHAAPVSAEGWHAYQRALELTGPVPTLVEWDNDLPSWSRLLDEANRARIIQWAALSHERQPQPLNVTE